MSTPASTPGRELPRGFQSRGDVLLRVTAGESETEMSLAIAGGLADGDVVFERAIVTTLTVDDGLVEGIGTALQAEPPKDGKPPRLPGGLDSPRQRLWAAIDGAKDKASEVRKRLAGRAPARAGPAPRRRSRGTGSGDARRAPPPGTSLLGGRCLAMRSLPCLRTCRSRRKPILGLGRGRGGTPLSSSSKSSSKAGWSLPR